METYYHMTNYENLKNIAEEGLVPKSGSRTRSIGDKRCAVFLSLGISNAIFMYNCLLHHYNSFAGERGIRAIERYQRSIGQYQEMSKTSPLSEEDSIELEALIGAIKWIKQIMAYKDFYDYIGEGVYLTISEVENIHFEDIKDCYTTEIIPPENIKVVILRNKKTGELVDYRECVLAYFMSITPFEDILEDVYNIVTIKTIRDLYLNREKDINYYNEDHFEMLEIPISVYMKEREKNKEKYIGKGQYTTR